MMEKNLMVHDYMLNKALDKVKGIISTDNFDNAKILIDADDKLPSYIALNNFVILMTCVVKDDGKFYP